MFDTTFEARGSYFTFDIKREKFNDMVKEIEAHPELLLISYVQDDRETFFRIQIGIHACNSVPDYVIDFINKYSSKKDKIIKG